MSIPDQSMQVFILILSASLGFSLVASRLVGKNTATQWTKNKFWVTEEIPWMVFIRNCRQENDQTSSATNSAEIDGPELSGPEINEPEINIPIPPPLPNNGPTKVNQKFSYSIMGYLFFVFEPKHLC